MEENNPPTDDVVGQKRNPENDFSRLVEIVDSIPKTEKKISTVDELRQKQKEQSLRERETHRDGEARYYKLRDKWSKYIFWFVLAMILFETCITLLIGAGRLDYTNYETFLYIVIAENFAQIVGMGYIVANYLFPKAKKDTA